MSHKVIPAWKRRPVIAWVFYDWANSAFATTVMAGFFPLFFKEYWAGGLSASKSTFLLGNINAIASLIIVILAPVLGAVADQGGARKRYLIFFAMMGIVMTGGLYLVAQGDWMMASILYALAIIGFSGGNAFYDSLLVNVARAREFDLVSAMGFSLGYLGGGLLFTFDVLMTLYPASFGLTDAAAAVRLSFLTVAVWWALFSIPVYLFVREPKPKSAGRWRETVSGGFYQLRDTFHEIRRLRMTFLFLLAYWLYIDGVDTIIRMAVDYGLSIGFSTNGLITALLITQFVGFPAALLFGRFGARYGASKGIFFAIFIYLIVTVWAYRMEHEWEFYAMAVSIGLVQGGIQSLSRSYYARLIPRDRAGEFFGFYNMLGKSAAVVGPLLMAWITLLTDNPRLAILSIALLFILGALILALVDAEEGQRQARELETGFILDAG